MFTNASQTVPAMLGNGTVLNPVDQSKLQTFADAENMRLREYAEARQAYNGVFADPYVRRVGDINDMVKVNRIKPIVNATVNFLFGSAPGWELPADLDGENSDEESDPEKWLDACLAANKWESILLDLGINGALCGTPYIGIDLSNLIPNPDDPKRPFPRLHVLDPADMTIRWSPRDIGCVTAYIWQYNTYDQERRVPVVLRRRIELQDDGTWLITDERSYTPNLLQAGDWVADGEPIKWPFSWPPVIHCKNLPSPNEVYGEPDVSPMVIALNKARNFNLTNWSRIVRKHSQPKPWVKGMGGKAINLDSEVIDMPSKDAEIGQLTPVVDGASSETLGRVIDAAICEETQTPSLLLGRPDQQGTPSGVALRIKLWPIINKTQTKQTLYGPMIIELFRRLYEAAAYGTDYIVTLKWAEALPMDPLQERQVIALDLEMGVASKKTASQKLGYNYKEEQDNIQQEAASSAGPEVTDMKPLQAKTPNASNASHALQPMMDEGAQGPRSSGPNALTPQHATPAAAGQAQATIEAQVQQRLQGYLGKPFSAIAAKVASAGGGGK